MHMVYRAWIRETACGALVILLPSAFRDHVWCNGVSLRKTISKPERSGQQPKMSNPPSDERGKPNEAESKMETNEMDGRNGKT